jgi:hypothetical protein
MPSPDTVRLLSESDAEAPSSMVAFDLSDPWTFAALLLFGLLVVVALYRSTRACCTCRVMRERELDP